MHRIVTAREQAEMLLPWRAAMPWYHNTDAELNPGDELVPPAERGYDSPHKNAPGYSPHHVYMYDHNSNNDHDYWGKNRYEVEPIGEVSRDPEFEHNKVWYKEDLEDDDEYFDADVPGYDSYVAPRARVVRKM
ncbi:hypothetical protein SEA_SCOOBYDOOBYDOO_94 [Mycobacterium phage ScoobyDoobyDoo]|nr:hypothetical protein SEA_SCOOBYDOOBYDOO_94 [Mycobacterium phage ScoobyDoobyDoo]